MLISTTRQRAPGRDLELDKFGKPVGCVKTKAFRAFDKTLSVYRDFLALDFDFAANPDICLLLCA